MVTRKRKNSIIKPLVNEKHALFDCSKIDRKDFSMPAEISEIWKMDELFDLMGLLKDVGCLEWEQCDCLNGVVIGSLDFSQIFLVLTDLLIAIRIPPLSTDSSTFLQFIVCWLVFLFILCNSQVFTVSFHGL